MQQTVDAAITVQQTVDAAITHFRHGEIKGPFMVAGSRYDASSGMSPGGVTSYTDHGAAGTTYETHESKSKNWFSSSSEDETEMKSSDLSQSDEEVHDSTLKSKRRRCD